MPNPHILQQDAIRDRVRPYLEQWGSQSLAYSCFQPDMEFFEIFEVGILPYCRTMGTTIALGNPMCAPEREVEFLEAFLTQHPNALFAQVQGSTASTLRRLGLYVTPMGMDTLVDIASFDLRGKAKRDLRHYRNKTSTAGIEIHERLDTPAKRFELHQLSKIWIQSQKVSRRELSFLIRPLVRKPESGVRIFTASHGSQTLGFVIFDPIYEDGHCTGYTASILRSLPNAPEGTLDSIIFQAIEQFKSELCSTLSLGVMPMFDMKATARKCGRGALPLYYFCRALYDSHWQPLSNLRGLSFHKSRYRPEMTPVFVATTSRIGLLQMTALTRACGLLP